MLSSYSLYNLIRDLTKDTCKNKCSLHSQTLLTGEISHRWLMARLFAHSVCFIEWIVHFSEEMLNLLLLVFQNNAQMNKFQLIGECGFRLGYQLQVA
jgi:hypothetical protein